VIEGTTDDYEQHTGRGRFTFYTDYFRLDSMYSRASRSGTSEFNGAELTVSAMYVGEYVTFGFSARPPMKIRRSYSGSLFVDTTGVPSSTLEEFKDEVTLPWRGSVGVSIAVRGNLRLGFEYELRPYASAEYGGPFQSTDNPWLSTSVFHAGLEYVAEPWIVLRAGVRGRAEVFEPEGNPIEDEPVRYSTYSAGCGFVLGPARLNVTYEYSRLKYQDVWGSAVSLNTDTQHSLVADLAIEIPRSF
jgi:opacity protein-like surface antigen